MFEQTTNCSFSVKLIWKVNKYTEAPFVEIYLRPSQSLKLSLFSRNHPKQNDLSILTICSSGASKRTTWERRPDPYRLRAGFLQWSQRQRRFRWGNRRVLRLCGRCPIKVGRFLQLPQRVCAHPSYNRALAAVFNQAAINSSFFLVHPACNDRVNIQTASSTCKSRAVFEWTLNR